MEKHKKTEETNGNNSTLLCRYCHRELSSLSLYSQETQIPMCEFCEVKHKEFEEVKKIQEERESH